MKQHALFDGIPDVVRRGIRNPSRQRTKTVLSERACKQCEKHFRPTHKAQRYCGPRCIKAANAAKARRQYRIHIDRNRSYGREYSAAYRAKNPNYQKDYRHRTLERHRILEAARRKKNADRYLDRHLRRAYGITLDEYYRMLREQDGCCAICRAREGRSKSGGVRLHVDHDHATGTVRGLLCHACNCGIGYLADDPQRMHAAVRYIERAQRQTSTLRLASSQER